MKFFHKILEAIGIKSAHASTPPATDPSAAPPTGNGASDESTSHATGASVDVNSTLEALSAQHPGLNWKTSIVDLLKLLDIDSSFANREVLAKELGYTGSTAQADSAAMNTWLIGAVRTKLAENGGKVPSDLGK